MKFSFVRLITLFVLFFAFGCTFAQAQDGRNDPIEIVSINPAYSFANISFANTLFGTSYRATGFSDDGLVTYLNVTLEDEFTTQTAIDAPSVAYLLVCAFVARPADEVAVSMGYVREGGEYAVYSFTRVRCTSAATVN